MTNPRYILNKLKWKESDLVSSEIWYIHRGDPNDTRIISGKDVVELDRSFMHTTSASIPYHRILKIVYKGKNVFKRKNVT